MKHSRCVTTVASNNLTDNSYKVRQKTRLWEVILPIASIDQIKNFVSIMGHYLGGIVLLTAFSC